MVTEHDAEITRRLDRLAQADEIADAVDERMKERDEKRGPVLPLSPFVKVLGTLTMLVAIAGGIRGFFA